MKSADSTVLVNTYNKILSELLYKHAPETTTTRHPRKSEIWFVNDCRQMKREMRRFERCYKLWRPRVNLEIWLTAQNNYLKTLRQKKSTFWQVRINAQHGNPRHLRRSLRTICVDERNKAETGFKSNDFAKFFKEKVEKILASTATAPPPHITSKTSSELQAFTGTSVNDMCRLIADAPNKQCELDPIATWLLKECATDLAPFLWTCSKSHSVLERYRWLWRSQLLRQFSRSPILIRTALQTIIQSLTCH